MVKHHDIPLSMNGDWKASKATAHSLPLGSKCWQITFSCGWIGVGNHLLQYCYQGHSNCSLCGTHGEKVSRVLHWPDPEAVSFATTQIKSIFSNRLTQETTKEAIATAIVDNFLPLWQNLPICAWSYCSDFWPAFMAQQIIGWNSRLLGRWSSYCQHIHAAYFFLIGSRHSPWRWTASIIHQFFLLLCWDFWHSGNDRLHRTAGTLAHTHHASLNKNIEDELNQWPDGLTFNSHHFLHISLALLKQFSLSRKEQRLSSVRIGR